MTVQSSSFPFITGGSFANHRGLSDQDQPRVYKDSLLLIGLIATPGRGLTHMNQEFAPGRLPSSLERTS